MKQKNYVNETLYVLSFIYIPILIFPFLLYTIVLYNETKFQFPFIILFTIDLLIFLIFVICFYLKFRFAKNRNNIVKNGIKVQGKIIEKVIIENRDMDDNYRNNSYYLIVKFNYNNEKFIYKTPYILFKSRDLTSKLVDVYILNNKYYVCGFQLSSNNYKLRYIAL